MGAALEERTHQLLSPRCRRAWEEAALRGRQAPA
eukprot:CAMPEP_0204338424 /NCGR_PEP_ID=MMETSP0469-20131031/21057_1 /ASSEMBLY_ACC=CAM_ASM_000384 /TAXON_ID=2969 /ORGANISM="Oxyrrhis marina" /LENGTH=33 /DNA_ID= /DNA_START= /DNA_END= /DNA_ORIENTATION=